MPPVSSVKSDMILVSLIIICVTFFVTLQIGLSFFAFVTQGFIESWRFYLLKISKQLLYLIGIR